MIFVFLEGVYFDKFFFIILNFLYFKDIRGEKEGLELFIGSSLWFLVFVRLGS